MTPKAYLFRREQEETEKQRFLKQFVVRSRCPSDLPFGESPAESENAVWPCGSASVFSVLSCSIIFASRMRGSTQRILPAQPALTSDFRRAVNRRVRLTPRPSAGQAVPFILTRKCCAGYGGRNSKLFKFLFLR